MEIVMASFLAGIKATVWRAERSKRRQRPAEIGPPRSQRRFASYSSAPVGETSPMGACQSNSVGAWRVKQLQEIPPPAH
jgi:hypothetical protein